MGTQLALLVTSGGPLGAQDVEPDERHSLPGYKITQLSEDRQHYKFSVQVSMQLLMHTLAAGRALQDGVCVAAGQVVMGGAPACRVLVKTPLTPRCPCCAP